jgi:hypothetical protein
VTPEEFVKMLDAHEGLISEELLASFEPFILSISADDLDAGGGVTVITQENVELIAPHLERFLAKLCDQDFYAAYKKLARSRGAITLMSAINHTVGARIANIFRIKKHETNKITS